MVTVLDPSIASSSSVFAIHANSSKETLFLSGKDIESYLKKLETAEVKVQDIDFTALVTAPGAAAQTSKPPTKEKEDAKIEGAVQIAIGVKKEVDFAAWYTNVRCLLISECYTTKISIGLAQSRYAGLLQRQWLLHLEAVVIQHLGRDSRSVPTSIRVLFRSYV